MDSSSLRSISSTLISLRASTKNKLAQVKYAAEKPVARAQAEATTIRIQAEAIQKQGGAEYVKLKWIEKWNGALPTTSLAGATPLIQL